MIEAPPPAPPLPDARTDAPSRRRLVLLVILGLVVVGAALALRSSTWAREYQLKRASLAALRQWAEASPSDPLVFFYLGTKAYNAQSLGEAGYCFQQAIRLNPTMARAHQGLAIVQRDAGRHAQAYASARRAEELDPRDLNTRFLVATLVMRASEARAIPEFQKVIAKSPRWAEAWYLLGICQEQINQKGEALVALRKAVALEPKSGPYHRDLGKVLLETNFLAEAQASLERARALDPSDPQTCYLLGETKVQMARSDAELRQADALLAESQKLVGNPTPDNARVLAQLAGSRGSLYNRLREPQRALAYLRQARKLAPQNLTYLYAEAEAYRLLGDQVRSRDLMARYHKLSAEANAAFQMTERIKQRPKDPLLRLKLARIYSGAGDYVRAVNQYEYCLYLDPRQPDARRELAAIKRKQGVASKPANGSSSTDPQSSPQVSVR